MQSNQCRKLSSVIICINYIKTCLETDALHRVIVFSKHTTSVCALRQCTSFDQETTGGSSCSTHRSMSLSFVDIDCEIELSIGQIFKDNYCKFECLGTNLRCLEMIMQLWATCCRFNFLFQSLFAHRKITTSCNIAIGGKAIWRVVCGIFQ